MKNSKRVIAGAMALLSAVSVASCGSSSGGDSSSSYVDKVKVASTDDIATIPDGSEKELEWLSYFDINPTKKEPEKRTDLTLFEEKGGKIKYSQTSSMNKYDKLAARLMSNNPPDMFWYEQSMTFPANCIKEMFQPVDDIVDFVIQRSVGLKRFFNFFDRVVYGRMIFVSERLSYVFQRHIRDGL